MQDQPGRRHHHHANRTLFLRAPCWHLMLGCCGHRHPIRIGRRQYPNISIRARDIFSRHYKNDRLILCHIAARRERCRKARRVEWHGPKPHRQTLRLIPGFNPRNTRC
jgi:hypothetical protein